KSAVNDARYIPAEPARPHRQPEGDAGGSDGAHVHSDRRLAPGRQHLSVLDRTQDLGLRGEGKADNLVEEEGAALSKLELLLDRRVRFRAAGDGDERLLASGTQLMDGPSHEFLAGADLALDEDREQGVARLPDLLDKLFQLLIRGHQPPQRAPDDLVCFLEVARALLDGSLQLVGPALQRQLLLLHLTTQLVHLNRAAQRRHEVLPLDRKSTRLNSSHVSISYAVFCLNKKNHTNR